MESEKFDALIRAISGDASRRGVVRGSLSILAASAVAALRPNDAPEAEAKNKKKRRRRRRRNNASPPPPPPLPPAPPPPRPPVPPPPPVCGGLQESCTDCTCPAGMACGDNYCDAPPVCCSDEGGPCGDEDCNCCHRCAGCYEDGLCHCNGIFCDGVCKCECCNDDDCGPGQTCDPDGVCVCPGGIVCGDDCCALGSEVCNWVDPDFPQCEAGGCPSYEYCAQEDPLYQCGVGCPCVTSIEGANNCTAFLEYSCLECTTDAECEAELGAGAFCLEGGEFCDRCPPSQNFCVSGGCPGFPDAQRGNGALHGRGVAARGKNVKAARQNPKKGGRR